MPKKPAAKKARRKKPRGAQKLQNSLVAAELARQQASGPDAGNDSEPGRPTLYSIELAARICAEIATTTEGLERICERNPDFPSARTIYRWIVEYKEFCQSYARAKRDQANIIAEQLLPIADTPQIGEVVTVKSEGVEVKRVDMIEHRRLQIDTRKWLLAHLEPKKWGNQPDDGDGEGRLDELIEAIRASRRKKEE